jgi:AcrR family transcriptional regulator
VVTSQRGAAAAARLVDAALALLRRDGVGGVSVQRVATEAGVSKGLVHYHFQDKDALLVACAEALAADLIAREEVARRSGTAATVLDVVWQAVAGSLADGTRRALLALCAEAPAGLRPVLSGLSRDRQRAADALLGTLEELLGWRPRVPRATLAAAYVALVDGLALSCTVRSDAEPRRAFDAFWYAVLGDGG